MHIDDCVVPQLYHIIQYEHGWWWQRQCELVTQRRSHSIDQSVDRSVPQSIHQSQCQHHMQIQPEISRLTALIIRPTVLFSLAISLAVGSNDPSAPRASSAACSHPILTLQLSSSASLSPRRKRTFPPGSPFTFSYGIVQLNSCSIGIAASTRHHRTDDPYEYSLTAALPAAFGTRAASTRPLRLLLIYGSVAFLNFFFPSKDGAGVCQSAASRGGGG